MKKGLCKIFFGLLLIYGLNSCDPCSGCGPATSEPSVLTTFYNAASLAITRDSLVVVDTLQLVMDSLLIVVDSIENKGGSLTFERASLEAFIDGITDLRGGLSDSLVVDSLQVIEPRLQAIISLLETGRTSLDNLLLQETGISISYDSAESHLLPVYLGDNTTNYTLTIDEEVFSLSITGELFDEISEDRVITRSLVISSVGQTGFDSLYCICNDIDTIECGDFDCNAVFTTLNAYF